MDRLAQRSDERPMTDQTQLARAARGLLDGLASELARRSNGEPTLAPFAAELAAMQSDRVQRGPFPALDHPGMSQLESALAAMPDDLALAPSVRSAARTMDWSQIFSGGGIEPNLAEGMLAAQAAGTYGVFASDRSAAGLFLLAPKILYPPHTHTAAEIYVVLSGNLDLVHGVDGAPFRVGPGEVSITPPNRLHALMTGDEPVLAAYVWIGDIYCRNWWWDRDPSGAWRRTAWRRAANGPWQAEHSEPITPDLMAKAHP
jgi:mannose-6-phosphate isomerase-like protein (cupin superfamily)